MYNFDLITLLIFMIEFCYGFLFQPRKIAKLYCDMVKMELLRSISDVSS